MTNAPARLNIGNRIVVQPNDRLLPTIIGRAGTVVEVFRIPAESCMVRIDGDPQHEREWFFYRDEVAAT